MKYLLVFNYYEHSYGNFVYTTYGVTSDLVITKSDITNMVRNKTLQYISRLNAATETDNLNMSVDERNLDFFGHHIPLAYFGIDEDVQILTDKCVNITGLNFDDFYQEKNFSLYTLEEYFDMVSKPSDELS
jgi:hypothetical protein